MNKNIAHKLEMPNELPKELISIVAQCEKAPQLVYRITRPYKGADPLEAALLKHDYKHAPSGFY